MTAFIVPGRVTRGSVLAAAALLAWPMAGIAQDAGQDRGMQGVAPPGLMAPEPPGGEALRPGPRLKEGPRLNQPPAAEAAPPPGGKSVPGSKGPAAEASPDQRDKLLTELYARLATAPDEATANEVATAVEQLWMHSGSATADLLVARAAAAIEAQRRDLAMQLLNAAVELQPDYAEAWNRRAYLFYIEDDYKRALGDLRRVLALEPHHYKALEGLANILQHLGEKKAALEAYESLLRVHPNASGAKKARDELKTEVEGQGI